MNVKELISQLKKHDESINVGILYDGAVRLDVDIVFESNSNEIVLTGFDQAIYDDESRPKGSVSEKDKKVFYTRENPEHEI